MHSEIRAITGLRAIAILSVLFFHIDKSLIESGFLGVDLFFVISGFVVANSVFRRPEMPNVVAFYYARLRRIFPPLITVITLTLVAGYFLLLTAPFVDTAQQAKAALLVHANYFFYRTTDYFADAASSRLFLHLWSLSIEEQFYLAFPLVLFLKRRWAIALFVISAFGLSLAYSWHLLTIGENQLAFYDIGARCWQFSLGIIGALIFSSVDRWLKEPFVTAIQILALAVLIACFFVPAAFEHGLKIQVALSLAGFVLLLLSARPNGFNAVLASQPFRFFGLISYSLYLYHWPVIVFTNTFIEDPFTRAAIAIVLSVALAGLSYFTIETYFRRAPTWRIQHWPRLVGAATAMAALVFTATQMFIMTDGYPQRLPNSVKAAQNAKTMSVEFAKCYDPGNYEVAILELAKADKLCRMGAKDGPLEFALIGDSHAFAMLPAIQSAALAAGKRGILASYAGCPPLAGVTHGAARPLKCADFFDAVAKQVKKYNIKTVFLVGRWDLYLFGGLPTGLDSTTPAVMQVAYRFEDPIKPFDAFQVGLKQTTELFKDVNVYFVMTVPQQLFDVPMVAATNFMIGRSIDRLFVPASISRQRREETLKYLKPYVSDRFQVFDPSTKLCDEKTCKAVIDGKVLYFDDDHISMAGAALFEPDFNRFLNRTVATTQEILESQQ